MFWGIGTCLAVAALLKLTALLNPAYILSHGIGVHLVHALVSSLELTVAAWIFSGRFWGTARVVLGFMFVAFIGWSGWSAISGFDTCGCVGTLGVKPQWTMGIGMVLLAGAAISYPVDSHVSDWNRFRSRLACFFACACLTACLLTWIAVPGSGIARSSANGTGSIVIQIDERRQPSLSALLMKLDGINNHWRNRILGWDQGTVFFTRQGCTHCDRVLRELARIHRDEPLKNWLVVILPSHGRASNHGISAHGLARLGIPNFRGVDYPYHWVVPVPVLVEYDNGTPTSFVKGDAILAHLTKEHEP